jgi:hypothetical protein
MPGSEQLTATGHAKVKVQRLHVIMDGMRAEAQVQGNLLFTVTPHQAKKDVTQPWGKLASGAMDGRALLDGTW